MTHNTREAGIEDCWCHKEKINHNDSHIKRPIKPITSPEVKNSEQTFTKAYFVNGLGEAVRDMYKWNNCFLAEETAREWMAIAYDTIVKQNPHHQLQKAKLEGYQLGLEKKPISWTSTFDATNELPKSIKEELQKARQTWLQEEIVRLEGMMRGEQMFDNYQVKLNREYNEALQTIIDRYQAELDQDKK